VAQVWGRRLGTGLVLAAAACGSDDGGGHHGADADDRRRGRCPSVTVVAGQAGTAVVTLSRGGGYAAP
jgi:hypothetical protein